MYGKHRSNKITVLIVCESARCVEVRSSFLYQNYVNTKTIINLKESRHEFVTLQIGMLSNYSDLRNLSFVNAFDKEIYMNDSRYFMVEMSSKIL